MLLTYISDDTGGRLPSLRVSNTTQIQIEYFNRVWSYNLLCSLAFILEQQSKARDKKLQYNSKRCRISNTLCLSMRHAASATLLSGLAAIGGLLMISLTVLPDFSCRSFLDSTPSKVQSSLLFTTGTPVTCKKCQACSLYGGANLWEMSGLCPLITSLQLPQ